MGLSTAQHMAQWTA
jgi:hypothetical protein